MYNDLYCTSTCTAKFDAFQECFHGSPTLYSRYIIINIMYMYCIGITKDVLISGCPHIHDIVRILFLCRGLHFSALVYMK